MAVFGEGGGQSPFLAFNPIRLGINEFIPAAFMG